MYATFGPYIAEIETRDEQTNTGPVTLPQLNQKYQQYNAKYFQNKLPRVNIRFANLPGDTAGLTSYTALEQGQQKIVQPETLVISINDMFRSPNVHYGDNGSVDTIMLHEMTHVLMAMLGNVDEKHGQRFRTWLQKLAAASGFSYQDLMGKQQAAESSEVTRLLKLAGIKG